ncbi:MAG: glycosyltransferase family 2 protein [Gammaproteobacteria bacterium]|nr:glycosyltransferase family 2 protein [Gammaproteobacteria bacterium]
MNFLFWSNFSLFWFSLCLILYVYIGYPLLIKLLSTKKKLFAKKNEEFLPTVSILIAAFNEEDSIEKTIHNKLELDYPADKLEIIVVSDDSTDETDILVKKISDDTDQKVKLVRQTPRAGKTSGLNLIFPKAQGEIIVFSDANSIYTKNALKKLVRNFSDPDIGYVTGKMEYVNNDGSLVGDGCSGYMKYENWLRKHESITGSIVGVDGGIDAMRKSLYEPLRADQQPDFVQPLKVIEKGYRVIYEPEASLREEVLVDSKKEFDMRVRVILRALCALYDMRHLFFFKQNLMYSFQLISHKLLRYLAFTLLLICFISNFVLIIVSTQNIYLALFIAQLLIYLLAYQGSRITQNKNVPYYYFIPYYFVLLNLACCQAVWLYIKGVKSVTWDPRGGNKKKSIKIMSNAIDEASG